MPSARRCPSRQGPGFHSADVLSVLVDEAQRVTGHRLGESEITDVALRLMADHTRTMTFLVSDGVIPSNDGRGYLTEERLMIREAARNSRWWVRLWKAFRRWLGLD